MGSADAKSQPAFCFYFRRLHNKLYTISRFFLFLCHIYRVKKKSRINDRISSIANAPQVTVGAQFGVPRSRQAKPDREERKPVFRSGRVIVNANLQSQCVIRDISDHGARIVLDGAINLPEIVILKISQLGISKKARVAWQDELTAGLAFIADVTRQNDQHRQLRRSKIAAD